MGNRRIRCRRHRRRPPQGAHYSEPCPFRTVRHGRMRKVAEDFRHRSAHRICSDKGSLRPAQAAAKIGNAVYELEKRKTESTTCPPDWASQQVTLCPRPPSSRDFLLALFWRFYSPP